MTPGAQTFPFTPSGTHYQDYTFGPVTATAASQTVSFMAVPQSPSVAATAMLDNVRVVLSAAPFTPAGLSLYPATVTGGSSSLGTVTLSSYAPPAGVVVALQSDNPAASVPASVTVPGGQRSATFTVTTTSGNAATATITATATGVSKTAMLTITPAFALTLGQYGVVAGTSGNGTITFTGTSPTPIMLSCSSDTPTLLSVPTFLTLPANQSSLQFSYTANDVFSPTTVNVTVSYNGETQTAQITIQPAIQLNAAATGNDASGAGKISLFWMGVANAIGYNIYRQSTDGGAFSRIASNITTKDTGPVLMDTYVYTDTGLTNGTSYAYYIVAIMPGGSEKGTSNIDADTPDPSAIPWDTADASRIVAAAQAEASSAVLPDPEDPDATPEPVGTLMIASPDGVVYTGNLPDGSPAQTDQASGYYDATTGLINYSDGTAGGDATAPVGKSAQDRPAFSGIRPNLAVGETQLPALPPTGITRQIQSQPGFAGMVATVGLPNPLDPTVVRLTNNGSYTDPMTGKVVRRYNSVGDIYTGGHVYFPASISAKYKDLSSDPGNIDAGLQLTEVPICSNQWQPVAAGTVNRSVRLGGINGNPVSKSYKVFVSGQTLMEFLTPAASNCKSKHIIMHFGKPFTSDSNLYGPFSIILRHQTGVVDAQGCPIYDKTLNETSVTLFYTGGAANLWLKTPYAPKNPAGGNNQFVIKRTNSIAQLINPAGIPPGVAPPYKNAPTANGPGNGFYMDGSYILGAAWGISDAYGLTLLYPGSGYTSWTNDSTITALAGSYPLDRRFIKSTLNNPYSWETNLNMRTSLGTLPGF